ncbi:MAG: GNAT family N-acetyltransferase [Candidatus Methanomethylophilaceae archaeon]|nr:GNAT family N-acetyltransferase [Candidatus Methanomethylophilaceae archaeon]
MRYGSTLLTVKDMDRSVRFYRDVLGLEVVNDFGANVTLTGGISLQTEDSWIFMIGQEHLSYGGNDAELYFEETDFDGFIERLDKMDVRYVHRTIEHRWGQRAVRIYDPDKHIIEIGEDIRSVCRRFLSRGMNSHQIAERMDVPEEFVRSCLARDHLETERLILRPWSISDAHDLYDLASDPKVGPQAGWVPHTDSGHSARVIEETLSRPGTFAIALKDSGTLVGCISIAFKDTTIPMDDSDCEIGFWIGSAYWNKGYATEACSAVLGYAFTDQGCGKVWCASLEANVACARVQEKLGFLFRRMDDIYNTSFGTRSMRISYLSSDRWKLLNGISRS